MNWTDTEGDPAPLGGTPRGPRTGFRWEAPDGTTVCASPTWVTYWRGRPNHELVGGPFWYLPKPRGPRDLRRAYQEWVDAGRPL